MVNIVLHFFENGEMLSGFNATVIAPVPKSNNVSSMAGFRRISCCSVMYKTVNKVLANRIKTVLPQHINANHSAFF